MADQRKGSHGPDVVAVQKLLQQANFPPGPSDGRFGPRTTFAVVAFQQSMGLFDDGIVGKRTRAALLRVSKLGRDQILTQRNPFDPTQRHAGSCTPDLEAVV